MTRSSDLIPNSFQVPNLVVDKLLPHLSGPEAKVLMLLCRKTFGWHKREDEISFTQFEKESGVSRSSAYEALRVFEWSGLLGKAARGPREINAWSLNLKVDPETVLTQLIAGRGKPPMGLPKVVQPANYIGGRTISPSELVQPAIQNYIDRRYKPISPGETTETKETQETHVERKGKWEEPLLEAWQFYCSAFGRGPQYELTKRRKALGEDGLRAAAKYAKAAGSETPDQDALGLLKLAIERMRVDEFHNGKTSGGTKYLDWEQLFTSKSFPQCKLVDYWLNDDNVAKWEAA